eukprot:m.121963 g.121963  ORF g.121963 m.121963 type:complete len:311 (+) comp13713_c0_seq1:191-1123(+)
MSASTTQSTVSMPVTPQGTSLQMTRDLSPSTGNPWHIAQWGSSPSSGSDMGMSIDSSPNSVHFTASHESDSLTAPLVSDPTLAQRLSELAAHSQAIIARSEETLSRVRAQRKTRQSPGPAGTSRPLAALSAGTSRQQFAQARSRLALDVASHQGAPDKFPSASASGATLLHHRIEQHLRPAVASSASVADDHLQHGLEQLATHSFATQTYANPTRDTASQATPTMKEVACQQAVTTANVSTQADLKPCHTPPPPSPHPSRPHYPRNTSLSPVILVSAEAQKDHIVAKLVQRIATLEDELAFVDRLIAQVK